MLALSTPPQSWTEFIIIEDDSKGVSTSAESTDCSKCQILSSKTQDRITMQTNTWHKLLSVRAIQKAKLLHYLLVKTGSQVRNWSFEDKSIGTLTSAATWMAGKHQDWRATKAGHANCFTFIIIQGGKVEWKQLKKNCSALQQGSEGRTQQETMHSNEYFPQLLED